MSEFYNFLIASSIEPGLVVMLMIFGFFIAIFHSFLILGLLEVNIKPGWIFFILNPAIIGFSYLIDSQYTFLVFFLLFISVFILGFYAIVSLSIKGYKKDAAKTRRFNKKYDIAPTPWWKKLLHFIFFIAFAIVFFSIGPYAFILIFVFIIFEIFFLPTPKSKFLKLQATLPTSRIRSVAMGLTEIEGKLKMIEPVIAPIKKKECIGFVYHIDKVHKNSDGDKSYSNVFTKTQIKPFIIKDDTGEMKVIPDKLEFVWIAEEDRYERSGKRYTQYLLKEGDQVLIIGKASLKNNKPVLTYESIKDIFAISPLSKVSHYNIFKPLLNSLVMFSALFAFISALILISPINIKNNQIVIEKPVFKNYWKDIHKLSDLLKIFDRQNEPNPSIEDNPRKIEINTESNTPYDQEETDDYINPKNEVNDGVMDLAK